MNVIGGLTNRFAMCVRSSTLATGRNLSVIRCATQASNLNLKSCSSHSMCARPSLCPTSSLGSYHRDLPLLSTLTLNSSQFLPHRYSYSTKPQSQLKSQIRNGANKSPEEKSPAASDAAGGSVSTKSDKSSTTKDSEMQGQPADEQPAPAAASLSIFQRFKETYKQHGKLLIAVHFATSAVWFGSFYYAAASGIDVIPILKWLGVGEAVIRPFTLPGVGNAAVAYLLYKIATPVRYMVTIVGTRQAVVFLRRSGRLPPVPADNTLRSLAREGQTQMKANVKKRKKKFSDRAKKV